MWVIATYEATTLFSLKPATATASGGKTLLVPTPYAIRMALVNVICQQDGVQAAGAAWDWLGRAAVALRPADAVVVNNTFIKILKPRRTPSRPGSQDHGYFGRTIAYREYAYLHGPFGIALEVDETAHAEQLRRWLPAINYLGKRGSFVQIVASPITADQLPGDFLTIDGRVESFPLDSVLTRLDDVNAGVGFEQINVYSSKRLRMGKERVLHHTALPYRLAASSRGYSYYERIADEHV